MSTSPGNESPETQVNYRSASWKSPEVIGELILLGIMAALIIAFLLSLPNIRPPGRWLPLVAIGVGGPLWFIRLFTVLRRSRALNQGMIMDLGFRIGEDPEAEKRRALLYFGSLLLLVLGLWVIGFHVGLPVWVMGYLAFWTRSRWYYYLPIGLAFECFIIGILDLTLDIPWFEPLFFRWIGVEYPINDLFTRVF